MKKVVSFIFIVGLLWSCFGVAKVFALTVSPLRHTLVVDPGKSGKVFLDISNDKENAVEVFPEIDAFELDPASGAVRFGRADEAKQWIVSDRNVVSVGPHQKERIIFTVNVPPGTAPSSHYLGLFAKVKSAGGQVGIGSRVGTLLFLHVAGKVEEQLDVQDFSASKQWYTNKTGQLFLQLKNNGTIHEQPSGRIELSNWYGEKFEEIPVNSTFRKVLPGEIWKENYIIETFGLKNMGKIKAKLFLTYGLNEQRVIEEKSFLYFPVWLGGVFVLIFVGIVGAIMRKKYV